MKLERQLNSLQRFCPRLIENALHIHYKDSYVFSLFRKIISLFRELYVGTLFRQNTKYKTLCPLKQWCTILGRWKIANFLKYHKYMQRVFYKRRNFKNKMQNYLDILRYVKLHSNKIVACHYWTILVTLCSHLLCTVMSDHFRRFSLVTKAPVSLSYVFIWLYVCFIIHLSVRLPLHLSVYFSLCPYNKRGSTGTICVKSDICEFSRNLSSILKFG